MIITHETPIPPGVNVRIFKGDMQLGCVVEADLETRSCKQDFRGLPLNPAFVEADTWDTMILTKPATFPLPSPWREVVAKYDYVIEVYAPRPAASA